MADNPLPIGSILVEDTPQIERIRRLLEQDEHRRRFARVHENNHDEVLGSDDEPHESLHQHPLLDIQLFDGEPPPSTSARREFDNKRREQELSKQLKLGLTPAPAFSSAPKPGQS